MSTQTLLNLLGLTLNIIGTVILAFSLTKLIRAIITSITAHEIFIDTYTSGGNILQISGTDKHIKSTVKKSNKVTMVGVALVILGFIIQLLQYLPADLLS